MVRNRQEIQMVSKERFAEVLRSWGLKYLTNEEYRALGETAEDREHAVNALARENRKPLCEYFKIHTRKIWETGEATALPLEDLQVLGLLLRGSHIWISLHEGELSQIFDLFPQIRLMVRSLEFSLF